MVAIMTTETREFPTTVIASLATGLILYEGEGGFSKLHEAAEFLMGHPIWTHHFASRDLWRAMRERVLAECPNMMSKDEVRDVNKENWREWAAEVERRYGKTVRIHKGDGSTAKHPLEGLPDGKEVVVIGTK